MFTASHAQKMSSPPCKPHEYGVDLEIFKPYAGRQTKTGGVMSIGELRMSVIVMIDAANCIDIQNMRFIQ